MKTALKQCDFGGFTFIVYLTCLTDVNKTQGKPNTSSREWVLPIQLLLGEHSIFTASMNCVLVSWEKHWFLNSSGAEVFAVCLSATFWHKHNLIHLLFLSRLSTWVSPTLILCWWTLSWGGMLIAEHLNELGRVGRGTDCVDGWMQQLCDLLGAIHTEMDGGNGIQCPGAHGCQAARIFQEVSLDSWGGSPFESGRGLGIRYWFGVRWMHAHHYQLEIWHLQKLCLRKAFVKLSKAGLFSIWRWVFLPTFSICPLSCWLLSVTWGRTRPGFLSTPGPWVSS